MTTNQKYILGSLLQNARTTPARLPTMQTIGGVITALGYSEEQYASGSYALIAELVLGFARSWPPSRIQRDPDGALAYLVEGLEAALGLPDNPPDELDGPLKLLALSTFAPAGNVVADSSYVILGEGASAARDEVGRLICELSERYPHGFEDNLQYEAFAINLAVWLAAKLEALQ